MAKQTKAKRTVTTKSVARKKQAVKKAVRKTKAASSARRTAPTRPAARKKTASPKKKVVKKAVKEVRSPEPSTLNGNTFSSGRLRPKRGTGSEFAGQSGDLQGLSRHAGVDSESVEELAAEGQYREAEIVRAVEDALDPDEGEVRTHQVPEDDVPEEYLEND